jgi:probable F420-dependent oxidoreductase
MKLGLSTQNTAAGLRPDVLARALEERGFESLFVGEHPHVPTSLATPYPAGPAAAPAYERAMDPFVSLMAAAAATSTLKVGTGVCLCLEHDVMDLAKSVSTLDLLSGGRVLFGVGAGWNREELANVRADIPWSARYRALNECVGALRALWTQDEAEFHGEFFDFEPVWSYPKPVQSPGPRILCGTGGKVGTSHAVQFADEWMPMAMALGDVSRKVTKFRQVADEAGRADIPISILLSETPSEALLAELVGVGVERIVFSAPFASEYDHDLVRTYLDSCVELTRNLH